MLQHVRTPVSFPLSFSQPQQQAARPDLPRGVKRRFSHQDAYPVSEVAAHL